MARKPATVAAPDTEGRRLLAALVAGSNLSAWARLLGLTRQHLNNLVVGHSRPGIDLAYRIKQATDIPVEAWAQPQKIKKQHAA